jgi:tRNA(Ser,Leu) C12 N-acetylase TAN1
MSLEDFLVKNGSETFHIAAAYQLLEWAKLVAYVNHKEKLKKYEEIQEEVATLVEKYGITDNELFGADCDLDGQQPMLEDDELMEMADKLVAHEEGWN